MNKLLVLSTITSLCSLVFLTSCKSDCNAEETHELISSFDPDKLSKFPFRNDGLDTFHYVNNFGVNTEVIGIGVSKNTYTESMRASGMDCQSRFYKEGELLTYKFKSGQIPNFHLYFMSRTTTLVCSKEVIYPFNAENLYWKEPVNDDLYYKDTIVISGASYSGIEITDHGDTTFSIFYNHHYGMLRIKSYKIAWLKKM